jgi:hypothetical protein
MALPYSDYHRLIQSLVFVNQVRLEIGTKIRRLPGGGRLISLFARLSEFQRGKNVLYEIKFNTLFLVCQ